MLQRAMAFIAAATLLGAAFPAAADPDKDESGNRRYYDDREERHHRDYGKRFKGKEEFWDGNCKVERKWEKSGEYKEERKCRGGHGHAEAPPYEPGVVITLPPIVIGPSGD